VSHTAARTRDSQHVHLLASNQYGEAVDSVLCELACDVLAAGNPSYMTTAGARAIGNANRTYWPNARKATCARHLMSRSARLQAQCGAHLEIELQWQHTAAIAHADQILVAAEQIGVVLQRASLTRTLVVGTHTHDIG
jgi:hypothetical protein